MLPLPSPRLSPSGPDLPNVLQVLSRQSFVLPSGVVGVTSDLLTYTVQEAGVMTIEGWAQVVPTADPFTAYNLFILRNGVAPAALQLPGLTPSVIPPSSVNVAGGIASTSCLPVVGSFTVSAGDVVKLRMITGSAAALVATGFASLTLSTH